MVDRVESMRVERMCSLCHEFVGSPRQGEMDERLRPWLEAQGCPSSPRRGAQRSAADTSSGTVLSSHTSSLRRRVDTSALFRTKDEAERLATTKTIFLWLLEEKGLTA